MKRLGMLLLLAGLGLHGCGGSDGQEPATSLVVSEEGYTSVDSAVLSGQLVLLPLGTLTAAETEGLLYMREEEKLAHDVYVQLGSVWSLRVFDNIADSEQTHTDAVKALLERYSLDDPALDGEGLFSSQVLQDLYDVMLEEGEGSLISALQVGAAIEEVDLIDLQQRIAELDENEDIELVYDSLMKGSRNHLRAFVQNLSAQGVTYAPQYLDEAVYQEIVLSGTEGGR